MKIAGAQLQQVIGNYLSQKQAKKAESQTESPAVPADEIKLSDQGETMLSARNAYGRLPEVRASRVSDVQARLASGALSPDPARTAAAMLKEATLGTAPERDADG